jgi:transcriptional regulator with XRE-family HTH domain
MQGGQRRDDAEARDVATAERLSRRLRLARQLRGLTLQALADAAGCSESLLSRIENGKASPSLTTLDRLSRALETGIGWLLDERVPGEPAPPSATAPDHVLRCRILHVEAGATRTVARERVGEEAGYLVGGQVELVVGDRVHRLEAGDTFAFRSDQPHSLRNVGAGRASLFWVEAAPPA